MTTWDIKSALVSKLDVEEGTIPVVSTGSYEIDNRMGGGVPLGSLTLIEGNSGAGKSVLTQQMMHGSLQEGYKLALFTSENSVRSLITQMQSLSLDIVHYLLLGKLRVYPIEVGHLADEAPVALLEAFRNESDRDMIFVDSLTTAVGRSSLRDILSYFEGCKRLCADGRTILVVLHSHGLSEDLTIRIRSICDAHLRLRTEEIGQKLVKTLEVTKIRGADKKTGNIVSFEVEPGWGMRIIPITKVRG
jgi:flagellar protein FlaH